MKTKPNEVDRCTASGNMQSILNTGGLRIYPFAYFLKFICNLTLHFCSTFVAIWGHLWTCSEREKNCACFQLK